MKPFHCEGDLAVLCTGGLHHLPYENQPDLLGVISHLLEERTGFGIIADPCIDDYSTEKERQIAAAKLGYEYLIATLENGAPAEVIKATADLISNDVLGKEFKTSIEKITSLFKGKFSYSMGKTWPDKEIGGYGDYYFYITR